MLIGEGNSGGGNEKLVCGGVEERSKRGLKIVVAGDVAVEKVRDGSVEEGVQGVIIGGGKDKMCGDGGTEDAPKSYRIGNVVIV